MKVDPKFLKWEPTLSRPRILVPSVLTQPNSWLGDAYDKVALPGPKDDVEAWLRANGEEFRAAVTWGILGIPDRLYDLPQLKLISCVGAGYDAIDVERARARGIAVTNCSNINHEDVADVAMGLVISATRHIAEADRLLRAGGWKNPLAFHGVRKLGGRKLGIVGLGAIGLAVAERAAPFKLEIAWWGPREKPDAHYPRKDSLLALAAWSDILVLAMPGAPETDRMIDRAVLDALGPQGVLINVARGSVVDEDALIAALRARSIAGAGLDVFEQEPTPAARWADLENVTLTTHFGGATVDSMVASQQLVRDNLDRFFAGEPVQSLIPELR